MKMDSDPRTCISPCCREDRWKIYSSVPKNRIIEIMPPKRRRICGYCGLLTDEEYSDEEWEAAGRECEECAIAELADGTLDE